MVAIGSGSQTYEWVENWACLPDADAALSGWAHPGVAVTESDEIVTCHPATATLLVFDRDGRLRRSLSTDLVEGHGITYTREGDAPFLWVADPGAKRRPRVDYGREPSAGGRVIKLTMTGEVALALERPDLAIYGGATYAPTSVAVHEARFGGSGDVWVADGYGQNRVHRYSAAGAYLGTIDGAEGAAGAFACPHGVWIDTRKTEPELYVADRTNHRIQVYDMEGRWKRAFGTDLLVSPSGFARQGDLLVVGELHARLAVLDAADRLVCYLGRNDAVSGLDGWPNMLDAQGVPVRTDRLQPGKFNSPHGIGVDSQGSIYVAEWLIGGRYTKLAKVR